MAPSRKNTISAVSPRFSTKCSEMKLCHASLSIVGSKTLLQNTNTVHSSVPSINAVAVLLILNGCSIAMQKYPITKIVTNVSTILRSIKF